MASTATVFGVACTGQRIESMKAERSAVGRCLGKCPCWQMFSPSPTPCGFYFAGDAVRGLQVLKLGRVGPELIRIELANVESCRTHLSVGIARRSPLTSSALSLQVVNVSLSS